MMFLCALDRVIMGLMAMELIRADSSYFSVTEKLIGYL
jgi:hypothetical protein